MVKLLKISRKNSIYIIINSYPVWDLIKVQNFADHLVYNTFYGPDASDKTCPTKTSMYSVNDPLSQ